MPKLIDHIDLIERFTILCEPEDQFAATKEDLEKALNAPKDGKVVHLRCINLQTDQWCSKKLYYNSKGEPYVKHTTGGYRTINGNTSGTFYLKDFTCECYYLPSQWIQI